MCLTYTPLNSDLDHRVDVDDAHTRAASTLDPAPCAAIIDLPAEIDDRHLALIRASKIFSAGELKTPPQTTMQKHLQVASEIFSAGALGPDGGGDLETPPQTDTMQTCRPLRKRATCGRVLKDFFRFFCFAIPPFSDPTTCCSLLKAVLLLQSGIYCCFLEQII